MLGLERDIEIHKTRYLPSKECMEEERHVYESKKNICYLKLPRKL